MEPQFQSNESIGKEFGPGLGDVRYAFIYIYIKYTNIYIYVYI